MAAVRPRADIYVPIAELLKTFTGVSSFFGEKHLKSSGAAPPRYVWAPGTGPTQESREIGTTPRQIHDVWLEFAVHCWAAGDDDVAFDAAWLMTSNLISAVRNKRSAKNYEIGTIDATPIGDMPRGLVLTVPVSFRIPIEEHTLDRPTLTRVTIESVGVADEDPSDPLTPDGSVVVVPHD